MAWCLFGAVVAINTLLSITTWAADWSSDNADPETSRLPKVLKPVLEARSGASDADVHLLLWFVAASVLWWALRSVAKGTRVASFVALWADTAGLELAQRWVPERTPQWTDLIANGLGIAAGATAGYLLSRRFGSTGVEQLGAEPVDLERQAISWLSRTLCHRDRTLQSS